jgi:glycosyltransferase 2 family protein
MWIIRPLLLVLGLIFLGALIAQHGVEDILASVTELSWKLGVLVCFPFALVTLCDTLGWRFAFSRERASLRTLLGARLAGEAFNLTTPTAALGGEAIKAWLLRGHAPLEEAILSVIVAKTTILIAQVLFVVLGIVVAWALVLPDSPLLRAMLWLLLLQALALGGFVVAQVRGMLGWSRPLRRLVRRAAGSDEAVARVDHRLASFYRRQPSRLTLSIGWHFVAWCLGAIEAYLALHFLGHGVSLATATVIEAFGSAIRFASFMIPASLGALEGGYAVTFDALGLGSTLGLSFSLVRRIREIAWTLAGLIAFAAMRAGPIPGPDPAA